MGYKIIILPSAIFDIKKLPKSVRIGVLKKIKWIGENGDTIIHHQIKNMPDDLKGICRFNMNIIELSTGFTEKKRLLKSTEFLIGLKYIKNLLKIFMHSPLQ